MGLRFKPGANVTKYIELLQSAAAANPGKFNTYTPDTMPEGYHFTNNNRIAPVWVVPNITYILTDRKTGDSHMPNGVSGIALRVHKVSALTSSLRIMDMITMNPPCKRFSLPMDPLQLVRWRPHISWACQRSSTSFEIFGSRTCPNRTPPIDIFPTISAILRSTISLQRYSQ